MGVARVFQDEKIDVFHEHVVDLLGASNVIDDVQLISQKLDNTMGLKRSVPMILFPQNLLQVQEIVHWAKDLRIPLYPISRGRNIGYGEWAPTGHGQVIVSLEKMNKIISFDGELGEIEIQPGVTQIQLSDFLLRNGDLWMADMTGAPPDASVLGNILEGGFGHSPLGNHREHILEIEAVLGNGRTLRTGRFPNLGPNLASLFVQSNFGIVTSVRIPLLKKTAHLETFTMGFKSEEDLIKALPELRELRHLGLMPNLIHVANSTRVLMSTQKFPKSMSPDHVLSEGDCLELLKDPLIKTSLWMGVGALYGTRGQILQSKKEMKRRLGKWAHISYFSPKKVKMLRSLISVLRFFSEKTYLKAKSGLESLESLHGLSLGRPSDKPAKNILWRCERQEDLGLYWISPVIRATAEELKTLLRVLRPVFKKFQFEMPLTLTLIDSVHMVCVLNISFNKKDKNEAVRALKAYREITNTIYHEGFRVYRKGVQRHGHGLSSNIKSELRKIKSVWDPEGIIAPGRYSI